MSRYLISEFFRDYNIAIPDTVVKKPANPTTGAIYMAYLADVKKYLYTIPMKEDWLKSFVQVEYTGYRLWIESMGYVMGDMVELFIRPLVPEVILIIRDNPDVENHLSVIPITKVHIRGDEMWVIKHEV